MNSINFLFIYLFIVFCIVGCLFQLSLYYSFIFFFFSCSVHNNNYYGRKEKIQKVAVIKRLQFLCSRFEFCVIFYLMTTRRDAATASSRLKTRENWLVSHSKGFRANIKTYHRLK